MKILIKQYCQSISVRITLLIFLVYLCYLPFSGYNFLPYDAFNYFEYAALFFSEGKQFSLINFSNSLRGYFFPLLLLPFKVISYTTATSPLIYTKLLGMVCVSGLFGLVIPKLWEVVNNSSDISWLRRVALFIVSFILWRDYFNFSLTDFPAILALSVSLILIMQKVNSFQILLAGMLLAAAINMRPLYIIVLPAFIIGIVILQSRIILSQSLKKIIVFIAGFLILSLPQYLINVRHFDSHSPLVLGNYEKAHKNLYLQQLNWGIAIQKYESNIGTDYPSPQMKFIDPTGKLLLEKEKFRLQSFSDYLNLLKLYPDFFLHSYSKHLFNGLDLQYSSPYIKEVYKFHWFLVWVNYTLLFCGILMLRYVRRWNFTAKHGLVFSVVFLPCLLMLPTAIECRFLLPLHLFICSVVCFGWPNQWQWYIISGRNKLMVALAYCLFMAFCYWLSTNTQNNLELGARAIFPSVYL